ncbi:MAG: hypothetical protein OEY89_11155 [Gammaproteobacteria bacterium]|nr:hypothetical protein [Gammaproteobacteria bacterium]
MSDRYLLVIIIVLCFSAMGLAMQVRAEQLDDPTRPSGYAKASSDKNRSGKSVSWELNAIKIDSENRMAIVNGRTVKEGGWINNAKVIEILPAQVKMQTESGVFIVKLVKQQVKVPLFVQDSK